MFTKLKLLKANLTFILILILCTGHCYSQQVYGTGFFTPGTTFTVIGTIKTSQNEWIVFCSDENMSNHKGIILKINQAGLVIDTVTVIVDSLNSSEFNWTHIIETDDHGFLLSARKPYSSNYVFAKLDSLFNVEWINKQYISAVSLNSFLQIIQLKDHSFLISTSMERNGLTPEAALGLCKLDSLGQIIFEKSIGDTISNLILHALAPSQSTATLDSGFVISGIYYGPTGKFVYVAKFDRMGTNQWFKLYEDTSSVSNNSFHLNSLIESQSGSFYISGAKNAYPNLPTYSPFVMKIDASGNLIWAKIYAYVGYNSSYLSETSTSDLILTTNNSVGCIIKMNNSGDTLWTRRYRSFFGGITYEFGDSLMLLSRFNYWPYASGVSFIKLDSLGYYFCNLMSGTNLVIEDINSIHTKDFTNFVSSTDSTSTESTSLFYDTTAFNFYNIDFCNFTNIQTDEQSYRYSIYPNPSNGLFYVEIENIHLNGEIEVYNSVGKIIHKQIIEPGSVQGIQLNNIAKGLYYIKIPGYGANLGEKVLVE